MFLLFLRKKIFCLFSWNLKSLFFLLFYSSKNKKSLIDSRALCFGLWILTKIIKKIYKKLTITPSSPSLLRKNKQSNLLQTTRNLIAYKVTVINFFLNHFFNFKFIKKTFSRRRKNTHTNFNKLEWDLNKMTIGYWVSFKLKCIFKGIKWLRCTCTRKKTKVIFFPRYNPLEHFLSGVVVFKAKIRNKIFFLILNTVVLFYVVTFWKFINCPKSIRQNN